MPQDEVWYNKNGDFIEEKSYTSDFIDDRRPQRIDAQTRLLKSNMGDQRQHRVFDSSGRLIEEKDTAATTGTQIVSWTRFKYDGHGRSIEDDNITDGKVDGFTLIKRDSRGNLVQMEFHLIGRHRPFPCDWYEDANSIAMGTGSNAASMSSIRKPANPSGRSRRSTIG